MNHFSVVLDEQDHSIRLRGELDLAAADAVRESVDRARAAQADPVVVLDLADVTFLDSTGLRELVRPAVESTTVVLRRPSPSVLKVLELAGVADLFTIVELEQDA